MFGKCEDCPEGQVPSDDRSCLICNDVYPGTVSDDGIDGGIGTKCVCPEGMYSMRDNTAMVCRPCTDLLSKVVGVRSRDEDPIQWTDETVCPGGITKHTRICPLEKLWLEVIEPADDASPGTIGASTRVTLLTCPSCTSCTACPGPSCPAACANSKAGACANSTTLQQQLPTVNGQVVNLDDLSSEQWWKLQRQAVCAEHHTGFLCADCEDGYKAIEGECTLCDKTDWQWIGTEALTAILIGLFLLKKTWQSVCPPAEAKAVFEVMDASGNGFLNGGDIKTLLIRMGNPMAADGGDFEETLADMKAKDIWGGQTCGPLRSRCCCCCGIPKPDKSWVHTNSSKSTRPHAIYRWRQCLLDSWF